MDSRLVVARRDLSALASEKTIVLALLIQLFVAAFSSFLVVGLASMYDPTSVSGGDVTVGVVGDAGDEFVAAAGTREGIATVRYGSRTAAGAAFETGRVDALVEARHEQRQIAVTVTAPQNSLRKTLVVVQVRETLEALERRERERRSAFLDRRLVPLPRGLPASPYFGFSYTVLLPLLVFLPVFISGSIAVDAVTEEIERGTLELLRVTPLSLVDVVDGKGLAAVALAPAQAALWLVLLSVNGIAVANPGPLLVLVVALALGLVALGVTLGLFTGSRRRAQLLYSLAILVAFSGGALLPEHPATTVALLAIDSPTTGTYLLVVAYALVGVGAAALVRAAVARWTPEGT